MSAKGMEVKVSSELLLSMEWSRDRGGLGGERGRAGLVGLESSKQEKSIKEGFIYAIGMVLYDTSEFNFALLIEFWHSLGNLY